MDRTGAEPLRVVKELNERLGANAFLMQLPMGAGETFVGVIDLVRMQSLYFDGADGEKVRVEEIPAEFVKDAESHRQQMLEALAMYSDELMELLLSEESISEELINEVARKACIQQGATPVFLGTAFRNKGVQPLLDAILQYLPSPLDREIRASDVADPDTKIQLHADPEKPFVGMAFKIMDDPFGQLTFMRIYQGRITRGGTYINQRTGKSDRFSRIVRMHADKREEIDGASAGDIVAVMGIDCASGDTYTNQAKYCSLESMFIPDPVIKIAVTPVSRADSEKLGKALQRFRREDPTFRVNTDDETGEVLISGMGELHLEIYTERIRREYRVEVEVGAPKVSYREAPMKAVEFNYKHKKQTGGSGQYAHIVGKLVPLPEDAEEPYVFEENIVQGRIPKQYIPSIDKGFKNSLKKGPVAEYPVVGIKMVVDDGSYHDVDSSDRAFQICAQDCFRETFRKSKPALLEPIMKIEVECPEQFQGPVVGDMNSRRGIIISTETRENEAVIVAEVPLAETFGYATDLRSMTQGQGVFSMELLCYRKTPASIQEAIIADKKAQLVGAK
jgi:elongation factor G